MWCSFTSWQLAQRLFYVSNVMKVYFCLTTGRGHAVPQKTLFRRELLSRNLCNTLKLPFCLCFVTNTYTLSLQRWHQITPHHGDSVWCNSAYSLLMKSFECTSKLSIDYMKNKALTKDILSSKNIIIIWGGW